MASRWRTAASPAATCTSSSCLAAALKSRSSLRAVLSCRRLWVWCWAGGRACARTSVSGDCALGQRDSLSEPVSGWRVHQPKPHARAGLCCLDEVHVSLGHHASQGAQHRVAQLERGRVATRWWCQRRRARVGTDTWRGLGNGHARCWCAVWLLRCACSTLRVLGVGCRPCVRTPVCSLTQPPARNE
jgi:hypothetical protein